MGTKVFAVRIGTKYGQDVEDYINSKIPNVTWIRDEEMHFYFQWNKLRVMNLNIDEPVVVIDIDMEFINDYMEAIDYPIERGEFLTIKSWWRDTSNENYNMNGGFEKFYPIDCKYIYEKFKKDPIYWSKYYINNGTTVGPVNGEQYFVEDCVKERLTLKFLPETWVIPFRVKRDFEFMNQLNFLYPGDYAYYGNNDFNEDIKILHYCNDFSDKEF